jgi:hypothetical protein
MSTRSSTDDYDSGDRNHDGRCLAAANAPLESFGFPKIVKAMAFCNAVMTTRDKGFDKAIFVSDCLSLIQRLNSCTPDRLDLPRL